MATRTSVAASFLLTAVPCSALDIRPAGMEFWPLTTDAEADVLAKMDIESADHMLRGQLRPGHFQLRQQEALRLAQQIDFASEQFVSKQKLMSSQLEQAGLEARMVLGSLRQASSLQRAPSFLEASQYPELEDAESRASADPKSAFPQIVSQVWQQRSPVLLGLLEVTLYGYVLSVCGLITLLTAIHSAICPHDDTSRFASHLQSTCRFFQWSARQPSSVPHFKESVAMATVLRSQNVGLGADGVEPSTKVAHGRDCPGYVDDDD